MKRGKILRKKREEVNLMSESISVEEFTEFKCPVCKRKHSVLNLQEYYNCVQRKKGDLEAHVCLIGLYEAISAVIYLQ